MKVFIAFWGFQFLFPSLHAQKPSLDSSTFDKWPHLNNIRISDDGQYSMYTVIDPLHGTNTLTIRSNSNEWTETLTSTSFRNAAFTTNARLAIFLNGHDSLGYIDLRHHTITYIPHIRSFALSGSPTTEWLALVDTAQNLVLQDPSDRSRMAFPSVSYYAFTPGGRNLLLSSGAPESVLFIQLATSQPITLHTGPHASHFTFDGTGQTVAYTVSDTLYYFRPGMPAAIPLVAHALKGQDAEIFDPQSPLVFNQSGEKILISLKERPPSATRPGPSVPANVDIWNYKDKYLQSEQLSDFSHANIDFQKQVIVDVTTGATTLVNHGDAVLLNQAHFNHYLLYLNRPFSENGYYDYADRPDISLVSIEDGHMLQIGKLTSDQYPVISPDERFLLWFNADSLHFFSYEIASGTLRNISATVPSPLYDDDAVSIGRRTACFDIAAWDTLHRAVYLYDKYDLWKVSLNGTSLPVNLTNGYGKKNGIVFGLPNPSGSSDPQILSSEQGVVLSAFNPHTKDNGFWELAPQHHKDPLLCIIAPYCYNIVRTGAIGNVAYAHGNLFLKAGHTHRYLVQKMSAAEYPNLYVTSDFHTFRALSDLHPESTYNWLRARLVTWTMTDGQTSQGILYLPENFDSTKKYPLLFNYYEKNSDELHQYKVPEFTGDLINVPYYVSNGYIMFLPDIYYQPGHNGQGVLNSILSAARYLTSYPWIDSNRMGIQGHSFGGWETNYLVTHSHVFAAAGEGAGISDVISAYDQLSAAGFSRQSFYETFSQGAPYGIGVTPWTHPEIYMENSPIFSVQNVTTPLLMMQGDADPAVPFVQSIEMYLALRRAGKKVWLLQYEHASHGLSNQNAVDYTLRLKQYFDYYLKGALPPRWMTQGVPAVLKGTDTGLELDTSGALP